MAGLLDFIKSPEGVGLLSAVGSYAANARRGTPINNIGRGVMGGVMGYANAQDQVAQMEQVAQAKQMRQLQMEEVARQQAQRIKQQEALANAPQEIRDAVEMGVPIGDVWKRNNPEKKWVDGFDNQGRPVKGVFDGSGFSAIGGSQAKPIEWKDAGGRLMGLDPYTGVPTGTSIEKTVGPDAIYSGGITMRGQNMVDARARDANSAPTYHEGAFVYKPTQANPTGSVVKIPGMTQAGSPTEGERKAATLLKRMEGSLSQLNTALESNQDAAKPGVISSIAGAVPFVGGPLGNFATGSDRQRVEAAQLDILDAALTLGTGAAYTEEQLKGYRKSYFPQIGDSDATVKDKQDRLDNVLKAARVAAGRAALPPEAAGGSDLAAAAAAELKRRGAK